MAVASSELIEELLLGGEKSFIYPVALEDIDESLVKK